MNQSRERITKMCSLFIKNNISVFLTNELEVTNIYKRRFYRKMDRHGKDSESDIKKGIYS